MKRCDKMVEVGRRQFLRGGLLRGRGVAGRGAGGGEAKAASNGALLDYPSNRLGNLKDLKVKRASRHCLSGRRQPRAPAQARHGRRGRRRTGQ